MLRWRMPPRFLPIPPRWGRALPLVEISCIFLVFELSQGWQWLLEVSSMPYWHRIGTNCVRTEPLIVAVYINFFCSDVVRVVFVGQFVHFTTSSSERPTSIIFLRNFSSRMNRSWIPKKNFFLHFFLNEFAMKYSWSPGTPSQDGDRGVAYSLNSNSESRWDPWCTGQISCSPPFRCARSVRTCNGRCRRPSVINMLCTMLWVQHRVIHTIRCSQLHESFVLILGWRDWTVDFVVGLVEERADSGGSRFSESSLERWRRAIASL